jgi:hypothetical protein
MSVLLLPFHSSKAEAQLNVLPKTTISHKENKTRLLTISQMFIPLDPLYLGKMYAKWKGSLEIKKTKLNFYLKNFQGHTVTKTSGKKFL